MGCYTLWRHLVISHAGRRVEIAFDTGTARYCECDEERPATLEDMRTLLVTPTGGQIEFFDHLQRSRQVLTIAGTARFSGIDTIWIALGERWLPRLILTPDMGAYVSCEGARIGAISDVIELFSGDDCPHFFLTRTEAPQPLPAPVPLLFPAVH